MRSPTPIDPAWLTPAVCARFVAKTKPASASECIEWIAGRNNAGYGQFSIGGRSDRRSLLAHRVSWVLANGHDIPHGMTLDHLCGNSACVNPEHLEPVTMRENLLRSDGPSARHARKTRCPKGHAYDAANTRYETNGARKCRECKRARDRVRRERMRAA